MIILDYIAEMLFDAEVGRKENSRPHLASALVMHFNGQDHLSLGVGVTTVCQDTAVRRLRLLLYYVDLLRIGLHVKSVVFFDQRTLASSHHSRVLFLRTLHSFFRLSIILRE